MDELLQVRGVTRALLYGQGETPGLAEYLTVFGTGAINVNTASPLVLRAALGLAPAEVDVLIGRRPYTDLTALPPGLRRGNQRTTSDTFRIEAWAGGPVPVGRVLTAIVGRQPVGTADSVPRYWRWSDVARTSAGSGTGGSSAERPTAKAGR